MRWATNLIPFGVCPDRFSPQGYRPAVGIAERIAMAAQVEGLNGVELHYPDMFEPVGLDGIRQALRVHGLECAVVSPAVSGAVWQKGALTNPDAELRRRALERVKEAMDAAAALNAKRINLWLGQDGFDYPFQTDYRSMWTHLADGIAECAAHNPQVQVCVEYKLKEPRAYIALGNVGKVLHLIHQVGLPNVGCLFDVGHALMARENLAESAVLLHEAGRLFHIHFNDTYGDWDWDLIAGSVHLVEFLELLWWLQQVGYEGWYSLDLFPQRENPVRACEQSISLVAGLARLAREMGQEGLFAAWRAADGGAAVQVARDALLGLRGAGEA